jgi:hypothetical protein
LKEPQSPSGVLHTRTTSSCLIYQPHRPRITGIIGAHVPSHLLLLLLPRIVSFWFTWAVDAHTMPDQIAATSAAQRHGGSEQMQRWLNTPRRQEPYVVGHGMVKKHAELYAEVNEAPSILQRSPGNCKPSREAQKVSHALRSFCDQVTIKTSTISYSG